ncbi:hypothetical protein E5288_WYG002857 [Bos mutus]|uniref:Uncharacterized protein n=1 Tax=Bos mutus TaxID=72004 RepID=A0A6B0RRZ2_9CETA|nr:hypothetical protein [Bos mutus]
MYLCMGDVVLAVMGYPDVCSKREEGSGIGVYTTLQSALFLLALPHPQGVLPRISLSSSGSVVFHEFPAYVNDTGPAFQYADLSISKHWVATLLKYYRIIGYEQRIQDRGDTGPQDKSTANHLWRAHWVLNETHHRYCQKGYDYHVDFQEFNKILLSPMPEKPKNGHPRETESYCGEFRGMCTS